MRGGEVGSKADNSTDRLHEWDIDKEGVQKSQILADVICDRPLTSKERQKGPYLQRGREGRQDFCKIFPPLFKFIRGRVPGDYNKSEPEMD